MPLALCRVDDRLVHGQVVIGWGRPLGARAIVLVDDVVATSSWEQDLYRMAAPQGVEIEFATTAEAVDRLPGWAADPRPIILLTGELETMATLQAAHPALVSRINLGGIHHRPGREERLRYLYLDDAEVALVDQMRARGAVVTAQDLPTAVGIDAGSLR
jgi:PTS system mannose-specific IIB component/fructoselysine and glucoselysine-specific PTS system IIB component